MRSILQRITRDEALLYISLSILIFSGFLHEPLTSGIMAKSVYWLQSLFIALITAYIILTRYQVINKRTLWILAPILALYLVTGLYGVASGQLLQFINGFRKILLAPTLFLLGSLLVAEQPAGKLTAFLVVALVSQIPASLVTNYLYTGHVFQFPEPDFLTGTFGRGGSSSLASFVSIVPVIVLSLYINQRASLKQLATAFISAFILIAISDIKFSWVLLPFLLLVSMTINWRVITNKWDRKPHGLVLTGLILAAVVATGALSLRNYGDATIGGRRLSDYNILSLEFLTVYLRISDRGIRYNEALAMPVANRYGSILIAIEYSTDTWQHALLGFGLDSTTMNSLLGASFVEDEIGIRGVGNETVSKLLLETGWTGFILILSIVLVVLVNTLFTLRKADPETELKALSTIVFLYGLGLLFSFPYDLFGLNLSTAGIFWLISGMWVQIQIRHDE